MDRRTMITAGAATAVAGVSAAACSSSASNTGNNVTQSAGTVNDMVVQQGKLSIQAWDQVKADPSQAYPVSLLKSSVELHQQREKLLRFNEKTKTGWAYLFTPQGQLIMEVAVLGKISSTQSSMTTGVGVYSTSDGAGVPVELPGDDLSFGKNEGGDMGKFFFTPEGVYIYWDGPILYADARLDYLTSAVTLRLPHGATPSSVAKDSTLFKE